MSRPVWMILILGATCSVQAANIYRCTGPAGSVIYSESPCGTDARSVRLPQSAASDRGPSWPVRLYDAAPGSFKDVLGMPATSVASLYGEADARYTDRDTQYWLYALVYETRKGERFCPELLIKDGKVTQLNRVSAETMLRSIDAARAIGRWDPVRSPSLKSFSIRDTAVVGLDKAQVIGRLGLPDHKVVHKGREVWQYEQVPMSPGHARTLTLFLEFEAGKVSSSVGN